MKTILEYVKEHKLPTIDFSDLTNIGEINLLEANEPIADPMAQPDAAADPLAGTGMDATQDPLAAPNAADQQHNMSQQPGFDNANSQQNPDDDNEDDDFKEEDTHEDDPDWIKGTNNPDDVMHSDVMAGQARFNAEDVLRSIKAVKSALPSEQLKSMTEVEKALTLIVNGKKLNLEDVAFDDPDDAMQLINQIEEPLDIKFKNYLDLKIKQPIIAQRDKNKEEIAKLAQDNEKARDTISALNKD